MGRSGSGKSTLLEAIAGLRASSGSVTVGDSEVSSLNPRQRARFRLTHIGFVSQESDLIPELTVRENVEVTARLAGIADGVISDRAADLMAYAGLDSLGWMLPSDVSGGEGQRAAVVRALMTSPDLVLADESTSALDTVRAAEITGLIVEFARREGSSALLATHDLDVARMADRILRISDGLLCEE